MVVLGTALQNRLLEVAKRELGPGGDSVLRTSAQHACDKPLDQLAYADLPALFAAVEQASATPAGDGPALALGEALDRLRVECD